MQCGTLIEIERPQEIFNVIINFIYGLNYFKFPENGINFLIRGRGSKINAF